jgi:hypothetical protein
VVKRKKEEDAREAVFSELYPKISGEEEEAGGRRETYIPNPTQPLPRTDIPFPMLLYLGKDPRLDERAARDHDAVNPALLDAGPVVGRRKAVAATEDGDAGDCVWVFLAIRRGGEERGRRKRKTNDPHPPLARAPHPHTP